MKINGDTAAQIEFWFLEGDRHCLANGKAEESPYLNLTTQQGCTQPDKLAHHWWTRSGR